MEQTVENEVIAEIKVYLKGNSFIHYRMKNCYINEEDGVPGNGFDLELESEIDGNKEYALLEDITRDFDEAFDILIMFAKNTVTPESAEYIMEDILSSLQ